MSPILHPTNFADFRPIIQNSVLPRYGSPAIKNSSRNIRHKAKSRSENISFYGERMCMFMKSNGCFLL